MTDILDFFSFAYMSVVEKQKLPTMDRNGNMPVSSSKNYMATCRSNRYTMGRIGNVLVSPSNKYMATCQSIRYTMGRNGNALVSPSKHYVWQNAVHTLYERALVLQTDRLRNDTISRSICACATNAHLHPW